MGGKLLTARSCSFACLLVFGILSLTGCSDDDNTLAPYEGRRPLANIVLEANSYTPKITWVGGYVSVLGVNRGARAALDTSLVWLIRIDGNNLHFPVTFGQTPAGAQNITGQYGGQSIDRLREDVSYTFWVLKAEAWSQVAAQANKLLLVDSSATASTVAVRNDSVFVSATFHAQQMLPLDVYVNIRDFRPFGRLAVLSIEQTNTSNSPIIRWQIAQAGVTDSSIAVIGLASGSSYVPTNAVWEAWSQEDVAGQPTYGKKNVVAAPVIMGEPLAETRVFYEYPTQGLERNQNYYLWIANKEWNGVSHGRTVNFYAYAVFQTW